VQYNRVALLLQAAIYLRYSKQLVEKHLDGIDCPVAPQTGL